MSDGEAVIFRPMMSGHCAFPQSAHPDESHDRCRGGQRANPGKVFQPCPCSCHFVGAPVYECSGCGGVIVLAAHWPLDEDGDHRYAHIDNSGRVLGEECGQVSRNRMPELTPEDVAELEAIEPADPYEALLAEMDEEV